MTMRMIHTMLTQKSYMAQNNCMMELSDRKKKKILALVDSDQIPDDVFTKIVYDALKSSMSGVAIMDLEGKIKWINPAFLKMFGAADESQLIDRRLSELFTSHHIHAIEDIKQSIDSGNNQTAEFQIKDEEGNIGYIELYYSDIHDYSESVIGKMVSVHNITDRKALENHLRAISAKLVDAQESERERVARELHDSVGASLVSLKFAFEEWLADRKQNSQTYQESHPSIIHRIQKLIDEIHIISKNLHPSILHDIGFTAAIYAFCRETQESFKSIKINLDLHTSDGDIPDKLKILLYRVIQEGVINSAKHAVPDTINIELFKRLDSIELIINDDGKGFDVNALEQDQTKPKGIGLKTLSDRADIYGGSFLLESTIGKGTTLQFIWPILEGTATP